MKPIKLAVLTLIALAGIVVPTSAQVVVFNSFGAGNTYNSGIVWGVSGASTSGGYRGQAEFFTPGISGNLSSILLATYRLGGSGAGYSNFYIAQDNGSGIPGAILESFTNIYNANGLLTLNSTVQPLLQAGTEYWLCDKPAADNSYNGWYQNNQGYAPGAFERSEWGWAALANVENSGVFRVSVIPVPEPSVTGLATLSVGCLLFLRLKKSAVAE